MSRDHCKILSHEVCMFNLVWSMRECDCLCSVVSFCQLATVVIIFILIYDTLMMAAVSSVTTLSTKKRSSVQAMRLPSSAKVGKSSNAQSPQVKNTSDRIILHFAQQNVLHSYWIIVRTDSWLSTGQKRKVTAAISQLHIHSKSLDILCCNAKGY